MVSFPPVFVISLDEAADRRKRTGEHLDGLGLAHTFVAAIDGRQTDPNVHPLYDGCRRRLFFGKDLTGGEMGCLLSHRLVLQKIVADGLDVALVLEDDAVLDPVFPDIVRELMARRESWKLVRFLCKDKKKIDTAPKQPVLDLGYGRQLVRLQNVYGGAFAYLVTREAAETLLRVTCRNWVPMDIVMGHS